MLKKLVFCMDDRKEILFSIYPIQIYFHEKIRASLLYHFNEMKNVVVVKLDNTEYGDFFLFLEILQSFYIKAKFKHFSSRAHHPEKSAVGSTGYNLFSARNIVLEPHTTMKLIFALAFRANILQKFILALAFDHA